MTYFETPPRKIIKKKLPPTKEELLRMYSLSTIYPSLYEVPQGVLSGIRRVGIIPYCYITPRKRDPELWFAVGIDAKYGELTDCGGGRILDEPIEYAAARELYEESMKIFDFSKKINKIKQSVLATDGTVCVFFVRVSPYTTRYGFPDKLASDFSSLRSKFSNEPPEFLENSLMYWISETEFESIAKIRTRLVIPRNLHLSSVDVNKQITPKTSIEISKISPSKGGDKHPLFYEIVRRLIYPVITDLKIRLSSI